MFSRRQFLERSLQGSSLLAFGATVPTFITSTAMAAEDGNSNVLVVLEMGGGNDGLNTVIPYADDDYHKARPTLRFDQKDVLRVDDHIGLNPSLRGLNELLQQQQLAIVQGVGYPNPNRSHFESSLPRASIHTAAHFAVPDTSRLRNRTGPREIGNPGP